MDCRPIRPILNLLPIRIRRSPSRQNQNHPTLSRPSRNQTHRNRPNLLSLNHRFRLSLQSHPRRRFR